MSLAKEARLYIQQTLSIAQRLLHNKHNDDSTAHLLPLEISTDRQSSHEQIGNISRHMCKQFTYW